MLWKNGVDVKRETDWPWVLSGWWLVSDKLLTSEHIIVYPFKHVCDLSLLFRAGNHLHLLYTIYIFHRYLCVVHYGISLQCVSSISGSWSLWKLSTSLRDTVFSGWGVKFRSSCGCYISVTPARIYPNCQTSWHYPWLQCLFWVFSLWKMGIIVQNIAFCTCHLQTLLPVWLTEKDVSQFRQSTAMPITPFFIQHVHPFFFFFLFFLQLTENNGFVWEW